MLKHLPVSALQFLLKIYNNVWFCSTYPSRWSIALVLAFPEPINQKDEAANYCPIALTSCVSGVRGFRYAESIRHHVEIWHLK